MKKLLLLTATSLLLTTTYAAVEWVSPPHKACTKNGGSFFSGGICYANWSDAKSICNAADARLPTIDELKNVVIGCGGEINGEENNGNDPSYQSCYKQKGFASSGYYRSSTAYMSDTSYTWVVNFYYGYLDYNYKVNNLSVRCVRAEQ